MYSPAVFELVKRFDELPDDCVLPDKAVSLILGVSDRTTRYRLDLPRVQISQKRYGRRVGDVRALIRKGRDPDAWQQIGDVARRVVGKIEGGE